MPKYKSWAQKYFFWPNETHQRFRFETSFPLTLACWVMTMFGHFIEYRSGFPLGFAMEGKTCLLSKAHLHKMERDRHISPGIID
jgi:hypothetical protein